MKERTSSSIGRSLLQAMVRAGGDLMMLRVGEKPFVRRRGTDIEIGTRELPAHVVYAIFEGFFPPDARASLIQTGHAHRVLPQQDEFPSERFSVSAIQREVLTLEILRRRSADFAGPSGERGPAAPVVLLIDDSEHQIDLYGLVLQDYFTVLQASSGSKGVQMARTTRPDAIVCDLAMPGLDGWEVCRSLAQNPTTASIPIIILTANPDAGLEAQAAAVGAAALLRKPCPAELLRVRIDEVLSPQAPGDPLVWRHAAD